MEMEKKFGVYLCKGCGIADAINFESLQKVIKKEGKSSISKKLTSSAAPRAGP